MNANGTRYAAQTVVPIERSKRHIEVLLMQHGAEAYHTGWDTTRDIIEFGWHGKQIRFVLPRYRPTDFKTQRAYEQADRARWRQLYLVIRAKIEAIEAGIAIFEEEFMAFIVVPGMNQTVGEILLPRIQAGTYDVTRALPAAVGAD